MIRTTLVAVLLILAASSHADATGPCVEGPYRQFDFLVGDWKVRSLQGAHLGDNSISRAESGCLLVERWRGNRGGTGQSYNFYHPGSQNWRQVWVSAGTVIEYAGGLDDAGAMVLEGEIVYHPGERRAPFTGKWTPRPDGSVLQELKQFNAETGSWDEWFTGVYTRVEP